MRQDGNCFAGQCDWRLPTIAELQTILDHGQGVCGGGTGPCVDPILGPTAPGFYWSATAFIDDDEDDPIPSAWIADFVIGGTGNGHIGTVGKFVAFAVRAVRGGLH